MPRLAAEIVSQIKSDITAGSLNQEEIAAKYGVSRSCISDISTDRCHARVPWPGSRPLPKRPGGQRKPIADYDPTDSRIQELEAEVIHLTEERNRANQRVKANAKTAGLFRAMVETLGERVVPINALPPVITPAGDKIVEHCVIHLSDCHADQVVRPEQVGGLEEYNFPIACARAERYVDTVLDWTHDTLSPKFHFPVLWVLAYGDFTSGEIHRACERSYYRNQFRNCLAIGQLHALMVRDWAAHFPQVNVLYLAGNHGRRTQKKDYLGANDNWDTLVAEVCRLHCKGLPNTNFLIPDAWSANLLINGVGFSVSHGDEVRSHMGIPFYGMVRRQKGLLALGETTQGKRIRYFVAGHHHTASSLSDLDGELLLNGSWVGTDSFAYNALAGYREPAQLFHGVNPVYGITWRMYAKLKHEGEKKGPKRYLIDGGRDIGPLHE